MNWDPWIPLLAVLSSLIPGVWIFFLSEEQVRIRTILNLTGAFAKLALIGLMMWGIFHEHRYEFRLPMLPGLDLVLRTDALAMLFGSLSAVLWLFTTIYAIAYLEGSPNRSRFFGFFSLCVSATIGIALAGNLFTFVIFYEMLTLTTYPLVVHRGTAAASDAGRVYLKYTLGGGAVLLLAAVWLHTLVGPFEFDEGASMARLGEQQRETLIAIFALLIAGLGVKAALVPLHGWLPVAMVAPAPVSALLHAVAVVKAGAFGIVRVVYDVYGIQFSENLGVTLPLAVLAGITIVYGSVRALFQDDLKRRLAFSTVSQVAYIVLGVAVVGPSSTTGGMVHLVHQGLMKITLFFCAGNVAETLGLHRIRDMHGVGRRMPLTMAAFTLAAFGMIGVPPLAGFVSKWYLGLGALEASQPWVVGVLAASTLLNAAYFLPILYIAWFKRREEPWPPPTAHTSGWLSGRFETHSGLLLPPLATALLTIGVGLLANSSLSPLHWVKLIVESAYPPEALLSLQRRVLDSPLADASPWLLLVALPLLAALPLAWRVSRPAALAVAPWSALPALVVSLSARPGEFVHVPWLLFSARLGLDETGCVFLFFTAALWSIAGLFAHAYLANDAGRPRFFAFFLATMGGNLGLIVAGDMATFYLFFALMSFASYGLIVHSGAAEARWAGKVYIVLVVIGEILLFVGILMVAWLTGTLNLDQTPTSLARSPWRDVVIAFLLTGFGIKAGALPLHVWLPLAHPVAPTPASAVLSGVLIKAGLLGWLRFLPLGEAAFPEWGALCLVAGLAAAFFGVIVGLVQDNAKVVLAYSSISQMGLMTIGVGAALAVPQCWPIVLPALWIYALHHALAKGALFLGVGTSAAVSCRGWQRGLVALGLLLPALALAGAPLTSGAAAKIALKNSLEALPPAWIAALDWLLPLTAVGTTLLMARFLFLAWPRADETSSHLAPGLWLPWGCLLVGVALAAWLLPWDDFRDAAWKSASPAYSWASLWPVLAGVGFAWGASRVTRQFGLFQGVRIPSGDVLIPVVRIINFSWRTWDKKIRYFLSGRIPGYVPTWSGTWQKLRVPLLLTRIEKYLTLWPVVGFSLLTATVLLVALLALR